MADLDGICMVKRAGRLTGADRHADDFLAGIKEGAEVMVTIRRPRSLIHHRKLFALLTKVVDNTDRWPSVDVLLDELKLATGHAQVRVNLLTGESYAVPASINFAAMSQDKFRPWFDRVIDMLAEVLGTESQTLLDEVLAMVAERKQAA